MDRAGKSENAPPDDTIDVYQVNPARFQDLRYIFLHPDVRAHGLDHAYDARSEVLPVFAHAKVEKYIFTRGRMRNQEGEAGTVEVGEGYGDV